MSDYMARVTSKGQLTLPAAVRKELDIHEGDFVKITITDDGAYLVRSTATAASVRGILPALPGVRTRDFDDLIEDAASAHADWFMAQKRGLRK